MRLRNNPNAESIMEAHAHIAILEPSLYKGRFKELFVNSNPIHVEVGMGKGNFLIGMAKKYPDINFIGIEKESSVLVAALAKVDIEEAIPNLKVMCVNAINLLDIFEEKEIDCLYLNFSDPWPKTRHYKRRLTYKDFLMIYQTILKEDGAIELKTDNRIFFESSILSMNDYRMYLSDLSLDLHNSEYQEENVMTEYEKKFSPHGPIYRVVGKFIKGE